MTPRPRVRASTPLLVVADLQRALDFYVSRLGFIEPAVHGDPPCFAMLNRDGFDLMLSLAGPEASARPNGPDGVWDLYLSITDVGAEVEALAAAGVALAGGPRDTFYAMREIEVLDPDGHRICLAQDLANESWHVAQVWSGELAIGGRTLHLVLKIAPSGGGLVARLDSPDQKAYDLPIDRITRDGSTLEFQMAAIAASYVGQIDDASTCITGTWTQRGAAFPLVFQRV